MVGEDERCGEERKAVEDAQLCVTEGGKIAACHLKSGEHEHCSPQRKKQVY